jgi:hypothetical protein
MNGFAEKGTVEDVIPPTSPATTPYTAVYVLDNGGRVIAVTPNPPQTPRGGRVTVTVAVE